LPDWPIAYAPERKGLVMGELGGLRRD